MTVTNIYGIAWPPHSEAYELPCGALWLRFLKSTHLVARWRRHFWLFFAIFSSFFSVAKRGSWCRSSAHKDMRKVSLESEICSTWQEETYHNYNYDICQSSDCYEDFCEWKYKFHRVWHPPAWKTKIGSDAVFQLSVAISKWNLVRMLLLVGQLGWGGNIDNLKCQNPWFCTLCCPFYV